MTADRSDAIVLTWWPEGANAKPVRHVFEPRSEGGYEHVVQRYSTLDGAWITVSPPTVAESVDVGKPE